jgi:arabinan endo-1,5-alpha-L-arabinosidase
MRGAIGRSILILLTGASSLTALAQGPREIPRGPGFPPRFHDPSRPVREGDRWWIFSTGNGISTRHSKDLVTWEEGPPVFKEFPKWHKQVVPTQRGHLWAPDIITHQGEHRLYYSVSAFGKNTSAIGLVTSRALDPTNPDCQWKDKGIIVQSKREDPFNAIDPHLIITSDGRHWMSFGSFWTGIQLLELDPETGGIHPERKQIRQIAWNETIEAPAILHHGGYYHLFVNWGQCCRGLQSTYEIRIGRSRSIEGPYLDKNGRDLATGGGTLLLASKDTQTGPGHASFISESSGIRMFYHYYDRNRGGYPSLASQPLKWSADVWPEL